jgi:hypothetical protein
MVFRNPSYLDFELLQSIADQLDVEIPGAADITRRTKGDKTGSAGISAPVLNIGGSLSREEEVTESFAQEAARPVKAMNDVIDAANREGAIVDLTANPDGPVGKGDLVELDGSYALSPATEIGWLMSKLMPFLLAAVQQGGGEEEIDPSRLGAAMMGESKLEPAQTVVLEPQVDGTSRRYLVMAEPVHLVRSSTVDDLQGDVTVFAIVQRLIPEGQSYSLERMLLPGMNPILQRAFAQQGGLEEMIKEMGSVLGGGRELDMSSVHVPGPALVLKPVSFY